MFVKDSAMMNPCVEDVFPSIEFSSLISYSVLKISRHPPHTLLIQPFCTFHNLMPYYTTEGTTLTPKLFYVQTYASPIR